jgi:hypothetical protein
VELTVEIAVEDGCTFLVNGLIVPPSLRFEGRPYADGWRILSNLKSGEIDTRARDCGWNFFFMAELTKRSVFGLSRRSALRRAAKKVLSQAKADAFNAVEITELIHRQLLGLHYVTVGAHFRSLQKSSQLSSVAARRRELRRACVFPGAERL